MAQKLLFCFTVFLLEFYCKFKATVFLLQVPYFGAFLQNAAAIESINNNLRKSCSALAPKFLVSHCRNFFGARFAHANTS
jgi:hypothetical protein